jgi:hypothetical protein
MDIDIFQLAAIRTTPTSRESPILQCKTLVFIRTLLCMIHILVYSDCRHLTWNSSYAFANNIPNDGTNLKHPAGFLEDPLELGSFGTRKDNIVWADFMDRFEGLAARWLGRRRRCWRGS